MSESIAIPKRKKHTSRNASSPTIPSLSGQRTPSSLSTSIDSSSTGGSPQSFSAARTSSKGKGKEVLVRDDSEWRSTRRASLLGSSLSKSEHTVINIGDPDGVPRLITCVKTSQGFDWNQEIFLPSYMSSSSEFHAHHQHHNQGSDLERRQDPVEDIILTEEEALGIYPV